MLRSKQRIAYRKSSPKCHDRYDQGPLTDDKPVRDQEVMAVIATGDSYDRAVTEPPVAMTTVAASPVPVRTRPPFAVRPTWQSAWIIPSRPPAASGFALDCGRALVKQAAAERIALHADDRGLVATPPDDLPPHVWAGTVDGLTDYAAEVVVALAELPAEPAGINDDVIHSSPEPPAYRRPFELYPLEQDGWPDHWRARCGRRSGELEEQGVPWPDSEKRAFAEVKAERARPRPFKPVVTKAAWREDDADRPADAVRVADPTSAQPSAVAGRPMF